MNSTENWWRGEINWATPAGQILRKFLAALPPEGIFRVIALMGHPTAHEMTRELQNAADLFRPGFDEESPGRFRANTERLWREVFGDEIDVQREIIAPAILRRRQGYGEEPPDYKGVLKDA